MGQPDSEELLECWKAIAAYLKKDVRTVQRWEHTRALPVHRTPGGDKAAVYAFKSELSEWLVHAEDHLPEPKGEGPPNSLARRGWLLLSGSLVAGLCLISGVWMLQGPAGPEPAPTLLKFTPFTVDGGWKNSPRFSPDGERVAYQWDGPQRNNFDVYVKALGLSSRPLRLTDHPGDDHSPAWSPDGREIAFTRVSKDGKAAIYLIPSMGGQERKLVDLEGEPTARGISELYLGAVSWSPDRDTMVYAESEAAGAPVRIVRMSIATRKKKVLTTPPPGIEGDLAPEFSPDGKRVAFLRLDSGSTDLWLLSTESGEASRLTSLEYVHGGRPVWTADGSSILFSRGHPPRLSRVDVTSREVHSVQGLGVGVNQVSANGHRLIYEQWRLRGADIHRVAVSETPTSESEAMISSAFTDISADIADSGDQVAFVSYREGAAIWKCDMDGSNLAPVTDVDEHCGTPRWSPDGTRIVFDSLHSGNWDLWIVDSEGGLPRQLTTEPSDEQMGTWSRDGKWIYMTSNRSGRHEVYRMPSQGGDATQVTESGGFYALESRDGKHLYYSKIDGAGPLFRLPAGGGGEEEIVVPEVKGRDWTVGERSVYFATSTELGPCGAGCSPEDYRIRYLDVHTGGSREIYRKKGPFVHRDLTVSFDEKWLLFSEGPIVESELMLAENFR